MRTRKLLGQQRTKGAAVILSHGYLDDYIIHGSTEFFGLPPTCLCCRVCCRLAFLADCQVVPDKALTLKQRSRPRMILPPNTHGLHLPPKTGYFGTRSYPSLLAGHRRTWWTGSVRQSSLLVRLAVRSGLA